jgi:hypothetical protein
MQSSDLCPGIATKPFMELGKVEIAGISDGVDGLLHGKSYSSMIAIGCLRPGS